MPQACIGNKLCAEIVNNHPFRNLNRSVVGTVAMYHNNPRDFTWNSFTVICFQFEYFRSKVHRILVQRIVDCIYTCNVITLSILMQCFHLFLQPFCGIVIQCMVTYTTFLTPTNFSCDESRIILIHNDVQCNSYNYAQWNVLAKVAILQLNKSNF